MFITSNQFYYFCACITFGVIFGFFYSFYKKFNLRINFSLRVVLDVVIYIIFAIIFSCFSYFFNFPSFRMYMPIGVIIGKILYTITFEIMLAKILKKGYNIYKRKKEKLGNERK